MTFAKFRRHCLSHDATGNGRGEPGPSAAARMSERPVCDGICRYLSFRSLRHCHRTKAVGLADFVPPSILIISSREWANNGISRIPGSSKHGNPWAAFKQVGPDAFPVSLQPRTLAATSTSRGPGSDLRGDAVEVSPEHFGRFGHDAPVAVTSRYLAAKPRGRLRDGTGLLSVFPEREATGPVLQTDLFKTAAPKERRTMRESGSHRGPSVV